MRDCDYLQRKRQERGETQDVFLVGEGQLCPLAALRNLIEVVPADPSAPAILVDGPQWSGATNGEIHSAQQDQHHPFNGRFWFGVRPLLPHRRRVILFSQRCPTRDCSHPRPLEIPGVRGLHTLVRADSLETPGTGVELNTARGWVVSGSSSPLSSVVG